MKANTFLKSILLYLTLLVDFIGTGSLDAAQNPPQWQPYPIGNNEVSAVVFDPTNPQVIYAAIPSSGVIKTTVGGQTWQWTGNVGVYVNVLRVAPHNPNLIYIAGWGMAKSTDGGNSWSQLTNNQPINGQVMDMAIDPQNPDIIYAGVQNGWGSSSTGNIYKSEDGGTTWQIKDKGIFSQQS